MKILSIIGARPEFVQAAPVSRALRQEHQEVLVHTGQHYDDAMSRVFFEELALPEPDYHLGVAPSAPPCQVAQMLTALEAVFRDEQPDVVLVRGDTNSTLAGGLAASLLDMPLIHVEAGERCFRMAMPEERNRLAVDHLAHLHLCASHSAVDQLAREGITESAHWVGDVMLDSALEYLPLAQSRSAVLNQLGLSPQGYSLLTMHRAANADDPARLLGILDAVDRCGEPVLFPIHPRTQANIERLGWRPGGGLRVIPPVGYLDMLRLESGARLIATDSGGVQREAYFLGVPCLTLREETEWTETVHAGWNRLVGTAPERIMAAWHSFQTPAERPAIFGDGHAAAAILDVLRRWCP